MKEGRLTNNNKNKRWTEGERVNVCVYVCERESVCVRGVKRGERINALSKMVPYCFFRCSNLGGCICCCGQTNEATWP
jgi:hypothetical protein